MARRISKPHRRTSTRAPRAQRPTITTPEPPHSQGGFRLPPGVSYHKEPLADGMAFVFRHQELGLLGRIILQEIAGGNSHISLELAGDPDDSMTAKRAAIFKPLGIELANRLEARTGSMHPGQGFTPPSPPPPSHELVESKLMQCERCGAGVALLIFAPGATDLGRFEDYARKMYAQVQRLNVPTYVIGPALGDGPLMEQPVQRLQPAEFNPIIDTLAQTHCR